MKLSLSDFVAESSEERRVEGGGGGLNVWMVLYYGILLSLQEYGIEHDNSSLKLQNSILFTPILLISCLIP